MNYMLMIISGILTALAFPTVFGDIHVPNLGFLAWFSLAPLFFVIKDKGPRASFLRTFLCSGVYYGISLYWLYKALNTYGHLSPVTSVAVMVLLIAILSAYIALAPMLAAFVEVRTNISRFWTIPVFWAALEFARNYLPCNGFPWGNITNTQFAFLPIIQMTDVTGIYGLTYIMILVNCACGLLIIPYWRTCRSNSLQAAPVGQKNAKLMFVTFLVVAVLIYGYWRIYDVTKGQEGWPSVRAAMLQGNIPQDEKWIEGGEAAQIEPYANFTKLLVNSGVNLIVWPEASYPWIVPKGETKLDPEIIGTGNTGEDNDPFVLLGALTSTKEGNGRRELSNSMLLLDKNADIAGSYSKTHLVPFGEYVPYRKLLFFAKKLVAPIGNFLPGGSVQPMATDSYQVGGLICYEDIFPELAARQAGNGANVLAVVTNDAWYGRSSAAFQHLAISVFRAVENRRWMVRSANSGVSAVVDAAGRIISQTDIFEKGMIVSNVKLGSGLSLYTRFGDWFAWVCVAAGVVLLGVATGRHRPSAMPL